MVPERPMDAISFLERRISSLNVDDYEIYQIRSRQLWVESKDLQVDAFEESVSSGVAIGLFRKNKRGFASASGEGEAFLEKALSLASNSLDVVEEGDALSLPPQTPFRESAAVDRELSCRPFASKAAKAVALERKAREFDRRVTRVRGSRYQEVGETVALKNSRGFDGRYVRTLCELSLMVMAEENGEREMAWENEFSPFFDGLDPARPACRAAEQAVSLLGAKPISTRRVPALLDPAVGASLLGVLSTSFLGDQVMKGKSVLKDKVGELIYSREISLVDDGLREAGYATVPFDGEGVTTRRKETVSSGRLNGFLHDLTSAARLKAEPTGNGMRPIYKEIPRAGVTNFFVEPGSASQEDLRREMGKGFWITDLIGVHTADPVTGDFSLGAAGFWLEGSDKKPVRGVAVSGNIHELFKKTVRVGSDIRFYHSYGCPSLLISDIDIGGV